MDKEKEEKDLSEYVTAFDLDSFEIDQMLENLDDNEIVFDDETIEFPKDIDPKSKVK